MQLAGVQQNNNYYAADDIQEIVNGQVAQSQDVKGSKEVDKTGAAKESAGIIGQQSTVADDLKGAPRIVPPKSPFDGFESKLNLEALIELISDKNKTLNSDSAKKALLASSNERALQNEKRLEELDTQIKKLEEQEKMSAIQKIMNKISAFFQLLGAIVSVVVAVVFPNPITIAAATIATVCAIDNALSTFSDGKISLAAGFEAIDKACGGDGSVGKYLSVAVTMALAITQIVLSFMNPEQAISGAANIIKGVTGFVQGAVSFTDAATTMGTSIKTAVLKRDAQQAEANQMMIQSILKQLDTSTEREMEEVKEILKHSQDLASGLEEILENLNAGFKSAATGGAV